MPRGPGKGKTNNPNGRPKGVPNKSTEAIKMVMAEFVGKNMDDMQGLFNEIRANNPQKAFDILLAAAEYVVPKLARTEQQALDKNGNPADQPAIKVEFVTKAHTDT